MQILDFFFACRPLILIPMWSFYILGHGLSDGSTFPAIRFVLITLIMMGVYLLNQVMDFESDRINNKGLFLQQNIFSKRTYLFATILFMGGGIGLGVILHQQPLLLLLAGALGIAYSTPPLKLHSRAGYDLVANALGYGLMSIVLGTSAFQWTELWGLRLAVTTTAVAGVFLHTTLLDLAGDAQTDKRTSGLALGAITTRRLAWCMSLLSCVAAVLTKEPLLWIASFGVATLSTLSLLRSATFWSQVVVMGSTLIFALIAGCVCPTYVVALALLILVTRIYYKKRFRMDYPGL